MRAVILSLKLHRKVLPRPPKIDQKMIKSGIRRRARMPAGCMPCRVPGRAGAYVLYRSVRIETDDVIVWVASGRLSGAVCEHRRRHVLIEIDRAELI